MNETYKREIPLYQLVMQYAYESQGYKGKNGETTFNPMTRFVSIHDAYTPGGLPLRVDIDHVARRALVAKTGSYWDLNETEKPTANALILATPGGALTYVLPSEFAPYVHNHDERYYTQAQTTAFLAGKSDVGHVHDDRYYTESEITTFLAGKSNTGHSHDDLYYTESEVDWLLGFKSNDGHAHDERYYTESEIDTMFSGIESLWTDAGGGEYQSAAVWLHLNDPAFYKAIRFSDAGANIHEMQIDYDTGFKFISENHNFYMNSETGLFTADSINAGGIAYPTAPPASDKLILVSASGATSYIDVPTGGGGISVDLPVRYIPMWDGVSTFIASPFSIATGSQAKIVSAIDTMLNISNQGIDWPAIVAESGGGSSSYYPAIHGEGHGASPAAKFKADSGYGCEINSFSGVALKINSGGAQITGTTTINGITYPATDGTAGQFLQTDGSGHITFATMDTGVTGTFNLASYTGITVSAGRITSIF